jgi:dTDP-glucose 4,6-dehydratase
MSAAGYSTLLVTGGAGFIGSAFVRLVLERRHCAVVTLDALTYAGNIHNLEQVRHSPRHTFVHGDIRDDELVARLLADHRVDAVVNFAAETHVDRSISGVADFVSTNVVGTLSLLECARAAGVRRFVQVSTDEVYGSLGRDGFFTEESPIQPNSPYSASKAGADMLVRSFVHTYGLDAVITRCSNNYGPYQFPEKLIPLMVANALAGKPLPVYGSGENVRDWIYVDDHALGVLAALEGGLPGAVYNFGAREERRNIDIVRAILELTGRDDSLIRYVADRPGHDWRYAIDPARAEQELGWKPATSFADGLRRTVEWYVANPGWLAAIADGSYREFSL